MRKIFNDYLGILLILKTLKYILKIKILNNISVRTVNNICEIYLILNLYSIIL